MGHHEHHKHDKTAVVCAIITVSDTRTEASDDSGRTIREQLEEHGHRVEFYQILADEPALITTAIHSMAINVEAIVINGGTGLAHRDTTYEAVSRLLDKEITGFGELFRQLSYEQIGPAAMLSRATAGVVGNRAIFSIPGSTKAVQLAMTKLIVPQQAHIVGLIRGE